MPKITVNELFYNYTTQGFIQDSVTVSKPRRFFSSAQAHEVAEYLNTFINSDGADRTLQRR
jgi:hypothetical protein